MVAKLIQGISIALCTNLVGAELYLWLIVNHRTFVFGRSTAPSRWEKCGSRFDEFDKDDSADIVFQDIILPALIGFIYTVIPAPIPHQANTKGKSRSLRAQSHDRVDALANGHAL
jgi:hypothetical protein